MSLVIIKAPRTTAVSSDFNNYAITKAKVLQAAGSHAKKIASVDFDDGGFTVWLKASFDFGCNESGCAGFEFDSEYDLLNLVKIECQTIKKIS